MIKKKRPIWEVLLKLSRPHFLPYLAGPYLIGYVAMAHQLRDYFQFSFLYSLFFFLIPANIILYGINDLYDQDTDALNPKKDGHEQRVTSSTKKIYMLAIAVSFIGAIPLFFYLPIFSRVLLVVFLLLCIFYSAKPFRLKAKPFVDSAANILYGFPAFIAVFQLTSNGLTPSVFFATLAWCAALHLFSAIPDIEVDKRVKLRTTAVVLGYRNSLIACIVLWFIAAVLAVTITPWLVIMFVYPAVAALILFYKKFDLTKIYWYIPFVNLVVGFLIFLMTVFLK